MTYPVISCTALDARDCRGLAEFYRELLGLHYRPGDEPRGETADGAADWLVLLDDRGERVLAVQEKECLRPLHVAQREDPHAAAHGLPRAQR